MYWRSIRPSTGSIFSQTPIKPGHRSRCMLCKAWAMAYTASITNCTLPSCSYWESRLILSSPDRHQKVSKVPIIKNWKVLEITEAYLYIFFYQVHTLCQGGLVCTWSRPPRILQTRCFFCCFLEILKWSTGRTLNHFTNQTPWHFIKKWHACLRPQCSDL